MNEQSSDKKIPMRLGHRRIGSVCIFITSCLASAVKGWCGKLYFVLEVGRRGYWKGG